MSHAGYLRDSSTDEDAALVYVRAILDGETPATAGRRLEPNDDIVLAYVTAITHAPANLTAADLEPLRRAGFSDREIHDIVHVACNFAYMNRLADALGVVLEAHKHPLAVALYGEDGLAAHLAWAKGSAP